MMVINACTRMPNDTASTTLNIGASEHVIAPLIAPEECDPLSFPKSLPFDWKRSVLYVLIRVMEWPL